MLSMLIICVAVPTLYVCCAACAFGGLAAYFNRESDKVLNFIIGLMFASFAAAQILTLQFGDYRFDIGTTPYYLPAGALVIGAGFLAAAAVKCRQERNCA